MLRTAASRALVGYGGDTAAVYARSQAVASFLGQTSYLSRAPSSAVPSCRAEHQEVGQGRLCD